ncbi:MAG: glycosyltransferase [Planctomycetota bacterium]
MSAAPPIRFVVPKGDTWRDLMTDDPPPPVEAIADRFIDAIDVWVVQTCTQLRSRGFDARLAETFAPGVINVTSYDALSPKRRTWDFFIVCAQHDRPRPELCDVRIVQNMAQIQDDTDHYIPHWPQPGLKPRDPARGDRIENLTYKGLRTNLSAPFRDEHFLHQLDALGMTLATSDRERGERHDGKGATIDWTDYREADLVLAVRQMPEAQLDTKPPTKLINAWLAGTPAILGVESAYRQLRESDLDYIEVASPDDVIDAITRLRRDPTRYRAMIEHGRQRAASFGADATAHRWDELLTGPVRTSYEQWCRGTSLVRAPRFAARAVRHVLNARRRLRDLQAASR